MATYLSINKITLNKNRVNLLQTSQDCHNPKLYLRTPCGLQHNQTETEQLQEKKTKALELGKTLVRNIKGVLGKVLANKVNLRKARSEVAGATKLITVKQVYLQDLTLDKASPSHQMVLLQTRWFKRNLLGFNRLLHLMLKAAILKILDHQITRKKRRKIGTS